jgi:NADH:ubiquinone oxidoreductase subunit 6 (subunit J)
MIFILLTLIMILSNNPFTCLIYLILLFIISSLISLFLGLEYISLVVLLIYVGALAILFLFVIMLLDIRALEFKSLNYKKNTSIFLSFFILVLIGTYYYNDTNLINCHLLNYNMIYENNNMNIIETLGKNLYNNYVEILIIISLILTIGLVGSLVIVI